MTSCIVMVVCVILIVGSSFYFEPRWAKAIENLLMGFIGFLVAAAILNAGSPRWAWAGAAVFGFVAMVKLQSAYESAFAFERVALAAVPPCVQDANQGALIEIEPDDTLPNVVSALKPSSRELRTRAGSALDSARLAKIDYATIQPVTLTRSVNGERLTITFGQRQEIVSASCARS